MSGQLIRGCVAAALADLGHFYRDTPADEWATLVADMEAAYQQSIREGRWQAGDPPGVIVDVYHERQAATLWGGR